MYRFPLDFFTGADGVIVFLVFNLGLDSRLDGFDGFLGDRFLVGLVGLVDRFPEGFDGFLGDLGIFLVGRGSGTLTNLTVQGLVFLCHTGLDDVGFCGLFFIFLRRSFVFRCLNWFLISAEEGLGGKLMTGCRNNGASFTFVFRVGVLTRLFSSNTTEPAIFDS